MSMNTLHSTKMTTTLLFLLLLFSCSNARSIIRTLPSINGVSLLSTVLSRRSISNSNYLYCDSWRLSVEANNVGTFSTIPNKCIDFVGTYINGEKYLSDSEVVACQSLDFAKTVTLNGDGKDIWVFDVDETLLSNSPYYADHGWGSTKFNETSFDVWVESEKAAALPASLKLYESLLDLGFGIVLLTGRGESQRNLTEENLKLAGYHSWTRLILRGESDQGKTALVYKSKKRGELESEGYKIHGNSGDQWSDLFGYPMATRSFKLPNPIYYIS